MSLLAGEEAIEEDLLDGKQWKWALLFVECLGPLQDIYRYEAILPEPTTGMFFMFYVALTFSLTVSGVSGN